MNYTTELVDLILSNDEKCYNRLRKVITEKYDSHDRAQLCAVVGGWVAKLCVDKPQLFEHDDIAWLDVDYDAIANRWVDYIAESCIAR